MISLLFIQMVKYAFGFPVVAMVSHISVKSRMAVNYVKPSLFYCYEEERDYLSTREG